MKRNIIDVVIETNQADGKVYRYLIRNDGSKIINTDRNEKAHIYGPSVAKFPRGKGWVKLPFRIVTQRYLSGGKQVLLKIAAIGKWGTKNPFLFPDEEIFEEIIVRVKDGKIIVGPIIRGENDLENDIEDMLDQYGKNDKFNIHLAKFKESLENVTSRREKIYDYDRNNVY